MVRYNPTDVVRALDGLSGEYKIPNGESVMLEGGRGAVLSGGAADYPGSSWTERAFTFELVDEDPPIIVRASGDLDDTTRSSSLVVAQGAETWSSRDQTPAPKFVQLAMGAIGVGGYDR